ncbi:MAG: hypothetical protein Q8N44_14635 [Rubrivivax sp.]|nr:hypothetical protein [Rubrivivax sp.]
MSLRQLSPLHVLARRWLCAGLMATLGGAALAQTPPVAPPARPAAKDMPVAKVPATKPGAKAEPSKTTVLSANLQAKGLFEGDKLSALAQRRLDALVADAADLDVEVAFVVPSGPWQTEGAAADERSLTPARLQALRSYLAQRGIESKRIYVESRIDKKLAEPRLSIELVGRPSHQ